MKKRTHWILWPSLGTVLLGSIGWMTFRTPSEQVAFTTEQVRRQDLSESITANGEIQAKRQVKVGTSVTAEIKEIHIKDGQWVKEGELLVTLDQERYRQQLAQAELGLRSAKEDLRIAAATLQKQRLTFGRKQTLHQQGLLSHEEFQDAKLALDGADTGQQRAQVAVQQAEAQVALAQDALSKTVIRASMGGRVTGIKAEKGETAIAGTNNLVGATLLVISDLTELLAEMKVGELDVVKLKPGQPAEITVDALPGRMFQGSVLEVASSVEKGNTVGMAQDAQTYRVRVALKGTEEELSALRPGMSSRIAVLSNKVQQVVAIPLQAVQERESKSGSLGILSGSRPVAYVLKDGKAQERTLKVGLTTRRAVQVLEGLKEGETLLSGPAKGLATLADGAKVKLGKEPKG